MPNFYIRIAGPAGRETYLKRGVEVDTEEEAGQYPDLASAEDDMHYYYTYLRHMGQNVILGIQMVGEPEWRH